MSNDIAKFLEIKSKIEEATQINGGKCKSNIKY